MFGSPILASMVISTSGSIPCGRDVRSAPESAVDLVAATPLVDMDETLEKLAAVLVQIVLTFEDCRSEPFLHLLCEEDHCVRISLSIPTR